MFATPNRIRNCAAFDAEYDICRAGFDNVDHPLPIHDSIPTGATDRRVGHLALFRIALRITNILGMQMNQAILHVAQPFVSICGTRQIAIARVVVYVDFVVGLKNLDYRVS